MCSRRSDDVQNVFSLRRSQISNIDGDTDGDGGFDQLQPYGGRSIAIWDADGNQIYDSGDEIEAIVAALTPDSYDDGRSDNNSPEGVEAGRMLGRTLAVVHLERTNQVMVYDLTEPVRTVIHPDPPDGG